MEDVSSDWDGDDARDGGPVLFEPGEVDRMGVKSSNMSVRTVRVLDGVMSTLRLPLAVIWEVCRTGVPGSGAELRAITGASNGLGAAGCLSFLVARALDFESFCLVRKSIFSVARSLYPHIRTRNFSRTSCFKQMVNEHALHVTFHVSKE